MFRLNNIKHNVLILSFATLLAGCGGGGTTTTTDSTTTDLTTTSTAKVVKIDISAIATEDSATIKWNPYEYTTKSVEYGTSNKYGSAVSVQEEGTVTLYNLQANTEYHYRIISEDEKGRPVVSNDNTFTTLAETPQPIVTDPVPTDPIVTDPIVTEPAPTDSNTTDSNSTDSNSTEQTVTEPTPTEPVVTEPDPTQPVVTEPDLTEPVPLCQSGSAMQQGQVKDSISGTGLADVTVKIDGCITQTDANGYYTLNNIVENDNATVNFEKEGYLPGSSEIQIKELSGDGTTSPNYLEYTLYTYKWEWSYESQYGTGGGAVEIPAGLTHTDSNGNIYSGEVSASFTFEDIMTDKGKDAFPGSFKGINDNGVLVPFVSYALMVLELKDTDGVSLNVSGNITLILDGITGSSASIIPLWYYDYAQGIWIEEGYATRLADGKYEATVSHAGTWSISQSVEDAAGTYTDRVVYPDGTPVKNIRVHAVGKNWITTDLSTDENGEFEIEVIPGEEFTLQAYHYDDKYGAIYNGVVSAIAPGEIVNNSTL